MAKPKSVITPTIVKYTDVEPVKPTDSVLEHIKNENIHVDQNLRDNINYARKDIESHSSNENVHITAVERAAWNTKETPQGAQSKANKVMSSLKVHTNDTTVHLTQAERELLKNVYTKPEVRNMMKHTLTGLVFLPSVIQKNDLYTKYPNPQFNSCVYIRSLEMHAIYNGTDWMLCEKISDLFAPEATDKIDGLMSAEDKIKLDSIEAGSNKYIHPDNIDTRHVSDSQIHYWNTKADNELVTENLDGLMRREDKIKLDSIEKDANNYIHPEYHDPSIIKQDSEHRFVTDADKSIWNNKADISYVSETNENTMTRVKSMIDSKVANIFNAPEAQLEVVRSLAFELKNNDTVKNFMDLYTKCVKNEEFQEHALNDKIHMSRTDIALLENVKSLLESGVFEVNIPESLPANGGNADTVGNYKPEDLFNNREFYDYTVGTSDYTKSQASVIIEKGEDLEVFTELSDMLHRVPGLNILVKPGSYYINDELVIRASNSTIRGIGQLSKLVGATIKIIGNNNIIENISFVNGNDKVVNSEAIVIIGDNNTIRSCNIMNYNRGVVVEGSNNKVIFNTMINVRQEAVLLTSADNSNYGNIVDKNDIRSCNMGIILMSTKNFLYKNHITNNNIINCSIGIALSNGFNDATKTTMNIISQNIVVRGNGGSLDYLPTHKTIISEFSSKNIISQNITSGKEIIAPHDALSNNLY